MRKQELLDLASELGIFILNAQTKDDSRRVAIHLLNPNLDALEDAIHTADRDLFPMIVLHSNKTFRG